MKKLTTLIITITALLLGTTTAFSAPSKSGKKYKKPYVKTKKKIKKKGYYNGHYNRRGVYTYTKQKFVNSRIGVYKNTYKHKIFPNGRHTVKLVNKQLIAKNRYNNNRKVRIVHKVQKYGLRNYLVTYRIKRTWYGVKKKVIRKKRLYMNQHYAYNK